MEKLQSDFYYNFFVQVCCHLILTESWLHLQIPDASLELPGHTLHLKKDSDKGRGGGLSVGLLCTPAWCHSIAEL